MLWLVDSRDRLHLVGVPSVKLATSDCSPHGVHCRLVTNSLMSGLAGNFWRPKRPKSCRGKFARVLFGGTAPLAAPPLLVLHAVYVMRTGACKDAAIGPTSREARHCCSGDYTVAYLASFGRSGLP